MVFFELWLENEGHNIKTLNKKEGRVLYKQFGQKMTHVIKDCTDFLNTASKRRDENEHT